VKFPFIRNNIPAAPVYEVPVYPSWYDIQGLVVPIKISSIVLLLTRRLLDQGFLLVKLTESSQRINKLNFLLLNAQVFELPRIDKFDRCLERNKGQRKR